MASAHLKRNQKAIQPYRQGGVFGLSPPESAPRDSRKRRKNKHTWIKHTLTPYFDGHLWRKYGQKVIKDAPYPRLYFRCSYREDRRCQASKLVQQVTHDDAPLYEVTYTYEHTCNAAPIPAPDVEAEDVRPASGGLVLRFGSSGAGHQHQRDAPMQLKEEQQEHHQYSSPFFMMNNLGHPNNSQQHAVPLCGGPPPTTSLSPSFPIMESSSSSSPPMLPWTDDDDILTWDWDYSPTYDLVDDHLQFGDHVQFPWKTDGSALANLAMGMEVWRV